MSLQLDLYNWQSGRILCFVSKPDAKPVVLEVEVDRNAIGQDILEKVCDLVGTVEKDYLGLQVCPAKREPFWMNLRNKVVGQVSGQPPYRFRLRVKYFVQPHLLLQDSTRQIFYYQLRNDILDGKLTVPQNKINSLVPHMLQFENGNYKPGDSLNVLSSLKFGDTTLTEDDMHSILDSYKSLAGLPATKAMNLFLKEAASLPSYGTESFTGKLDTSSLHGHNQHPNEASNVMIRIGPFGLEIVEEKTEEIHRLPFTAVQLATHNGKMIDLETVQDDGTIFTLTFRMNSERSSNALYRCITEMLAFFTWETVHSSVMHQFSRDFKGHLLALFRSDVAEQGKQYVFDVQRTWREAYDLARRTLYKRNIRTSDITDDSSSSPSLKKSKIADSDTESEAERLRERLATIQDALTCRVCMDNEINTVFCPCGHQVCCTECASQCQTCPICRIEIKKCQVIYPNVTRDFVATGNTNDGNTNDSFPEESTSSTLSSAAAATSFTALSTDNEIFRTVLAAQV